MPEHRHALMRISKMSLDSSSRGLFAFDSETGIAGVNFKVI
jgi:hypothetical protein